MAYLRELALPALSALLLFAPSVSCWGSLGHRTVGYLAEMYLTPTASSFVSDLLNGQDISDAAVWADTIRRSPGFDHTSPWHFIDAQDNPPTQCGVNFNRDCVPSEGCVVSAIMNQTSRMNDPNLSHADHGMALRFILHFIGDIHQPLHTEGEDRGGNDIPVLFNRKHTNLHAIWDTEILVKHVVGSRNREDKEEEMAAAKQWAATLFSADSDPPTSLANECQDLTQSESCSLLWAGEANAHVCDYVLKDDLSSLECPHSADWHDCTNLADAYYDGAVPIVDDLIGKAGRRLGAWVNALATQSVTTMHEQQQQRQLAAALRLQSAVPEEL